MKRAFLLHACFLASAFSALPAQDTPWRCHTIDASSEGADGVRLRDVNGDGAPDIATAWEEGGVVRAYLKPKEDQVHQPWPSVTVGEVPSGEDAVFVDLDRDGAIDVVSSCEGRTRSLFVHWAPKDPGEYLEDTAWRTEVIPAARGRMAWMYALPMDVDGKHGLDLIVAGKGEGAGIGWLVSPENPRDLAAWRYEPIGPMGWVMSIQLEDMDGDGDLDVLYSDRRGEGRGIYWLELERKRDGDQIEWKRHTLPGSNRENMFLSTGDLDGDDRLDVICAVRGGPLVWYRGRADGAWTPHEISLPDGVGTGKSAAIADIDQDGHQDLVFSCENATGALSGLRWLSWEDDPARGPWVSHEIGGPKGWKYDRLVLHDVDGDGDLDVLTCEERDQLGVIWYENPSVTELSATKEEGHTNILLIMADDLGYECLGSYGGTSYATPNLDRLATTGRRFTQCFSNPKCSPSRVTLLTGRYTTRTTMQWGFIPPAEVTFGNVLQKAGYATALAGKWQLGRIVDDVGRVPRFGFEEYCVWGWHEGPRYWKPLIWQNGAILSGIEDRYGPDVYTDFLIEFMERQGERSVPFLAYYPMALTHFPKKDEPKGPNGEWETFGEMVTAMDRVVGRLVEALDASGLRENTLVIFTADNGTPTQVTSQLGERGIRGGKGTLTDAGTRVPLIVNQPGSIPVGVDRELLDFTDFLPTLVELGGGRLPVDRTLDGKSFVSRLRGSNQATRELVYTEWAGQRWVRDKDWKLYEDGKLFEVTEPFTDESVPVEGREDIRGPLQEFMQAVIRD